MILDRNKDSFNRIGDPKKFRVSCTVLTNVVERLQSAVEDTSSKTNVKRREITSVIEEDLMPPANKVR